MNYSEYAQKTRSVKSILSVIRAKQKIKIFSLYSGSVYSFNAPYFVESVSNGTTALVQGSSESLNAGEFYYNAIDGVLYVRMSDDTDPKENNLVISYKLFLSDKPYNLPNDLLNGADVEFLPLIKSIGELKFDLDYEQTGVAIESNSSITFENTHGYFDDIFDTLIFENQTVDFYSWSPQIAISQARKIYSGVIKDKSFSSSSVSFNLVDQIYQLRKPVVTGLFSASDGTLDDSDIGTNKARIYGRVQNLRTIGIDKTLDGFSLSGNVTGLVGSTTLSGLDFFKQLSPQDKIKVTIDGTDYEYNIDTVDSDTTCTLSEAIEVSILDQQVTVEPLIPYRYKNRRWHIAGHELYAFSTTITNVINNTRFELASVESLLAGDTILISGQNREIRRISGNEVLLLQSVSTLPSNGDTVTRSPLYDVYLGNRKLFIDRDYTLTNSSEAILEIDELAEFNITRPVNVTRFTMTFTNGDATVSTSADVDLKTFLKPRDWIRSDDINHTTWYEILSVSEKSLELRINYAGSNTTTNFLYKNVQYIEDDSQITVSCIGIGRDGSWIKTPAQAVKDMVENDAGLTNTSATAFNEASIDCPYTVSYVVKSNIEVKKAISDINNSCFGSLYQDVDFNIAYKVLNADKDEDLEALDDSDILSFDIKSKNSIISKVTAKYRPFTDLFNGEDSFKVYEFENDFVNETTGIKEEREAVLYLYFDSEAETIAQRIAFFNSLTQNVITVKSKLNLILKTVNDKMYLALDRMFKRYGTNNRRKIGIINSITKNESGASLQFNDLSGVFNRVPSIAPNTANDFSAATDDETTKYGFIVDNDSLTPDNSNNELGNNLIG